jgi:hypothetical protein
MRVPDRGQSPTPTECVGRGFILRSTIAAQWTVRQLYRVEVPTQGIMPGNRPGLYPIEG